MPASRWERVTGADELTCVGVGWGVVARIHEAATRKLGVRTVGVVEIDPDRRQAVRAAGLRPFATIDEAAALAPSFWDIRTPLRAHVDAFAQIRAHFPAANVVIEKPVCRNADIAAFQSVLDGHRGRFLDPTLGAFGYEGTHLLAAVSALGPEYLEGTIFDLDVDNLPMIDPHGSPLNNSEHDLDPTPPSCCWPTRAARSWATGPRPAAGSSSTPRCPGSSATRARPSLP